MKLFKNAEFFSLNSKDDIFKAILVDEAGIIRETFNEMPKSVNAKEFDLKGKFVLPGFCDSHTHSFEGGLYSLSVDMGSAETISDVLELLRNAKPLSNIIFAYNFDENKIKEKRFPKIKELDRISNDVPSVIRRVDGHSCILNSKARLMLGGKIQSDEEVLREKDNDVAVHYFHKSLDNATILKAFKAAEKIAIDFGLTTLHTMIGDADNDLLYYKYLRSNLNKLHLNWILYPQVLSVQKALSVNSRRVGGCILADGAFGSYTAAVMEEYERSNGSFGKLYQTDKFWRDFVWEAHKNNLQVCVHAIGDAAVEQILSAYEFSQARDARDLRHQIIHCELISDSQIERMKKANVIGVMQPMFDRLWGGKGNFYNSILGNERIKKMNRLKSLSKSNVRVRGSSDWYITTLNPLAGIDAAERIHNSEEALDRKTSIELYTKDSAYASFDEDKRGTIEKGKFADMTVLSDDPFRIDSVLDLKVLHTIRNGKILK